MDESKSIFTSVTFWGAVLSFLIPVLTPTLQKYSVPVPDAASLAAKLVSFITFAVTIYGRLRATQPVHIIPPTQP